MSRQKPLESGAALVEQSGRHAHGADQPVALLTQIQICRRLGISDETWRRWRAAKLVPAPLTLPGRPRWRTADIEAFVQHRAEAVSETRGRQYFARARRFKRSA